jgi:Flp pilus assembly protein TadG
MFTPLHGPASRRHPLGQAGAAALEYAIILPALLLMVLGAIDVGRVLWTQVTLDRAVEAAARCGAINATTCGTATQIQTYAASQAYGMTVAASVFTAGSASCGVQVNGALPFTFVIPWMGSNDITLKAGACYPT